MKMSCSQSNNSEREFLFPKVRAQCDLLSAQNSLISPIHLDSSERLFQAIVSQHIPGVELGVIVICTGNSRRSMLAATMGNIAAAYHGIPELRFYSGGTNPSAFNPRTIRTLEEVGVVIQPTKENATMGDAGEVNPVYMVSWGNLPRMGVNLFEIKEFSKIYSDPYNPDKAFIALLVCDEADGSCPNVPGASQRIAMPFQDPKSFDGSDLESAKYSERRDEIGRVMLSIVLKAKRYLAANKC
jgi:protein-tyrosine-phosphatase